MRLKFAAVIDLTARNDEGSDTSQIMNEDMNHQSHKLDTWADTDSDEDSDDIDEFKNKITSLDTKVGLSRFLVCPSLE